MKIFKQFCLLFLTGALALSAPALAQKTTDKAKKAPDQTQQHKDPKAEVVKVFKDWKAETIRKSNRSPSDDLGFEKAVKDAVQSELRNPLGLIPCKDKDPLLSDAETAFKSTLEALKKESKITIVHTYHPGCTGGGLAEELEITKAFCEGLAER